MSNAGDRRGLELLACASPQSSRWRRDSLSDNALVKMLKRACGNLLLRRVCGFHLETVVHSSRSTKLFQELRCVGYEFVCAPDGAFSVRVLIIRRDEGSCEAAPVWPCRSLFQIVFTLAILHRYDSK